MRKMHIIMHTHWDREWYFSKEETQVWLTHHMREVFDFLRQNPDIIYILDGQSVMIDDVLALDSSMEEDFRTFVQNNQLRVGPWYTQSDLMIISGESIVRNLYYGITRAQDFGQAMLIGYAPDTFGHHAQMPQIYRLFDIQSTFFWRGFSTLKAATSDFIWQGVDGSQITGVNLATGYQGAKYLEEDPAALKIRMDKLLKVLDTYHAGDHRLIMNGHDQMPIQQNIRAIIQQLSQLYPNDQVKISDFESYLTSLNNITLPVVTGDLTHTQQARIHQTISSTRMDIKLLNMQVEDLIYHVLEPLAIIAADFGLPYPQQLLDRSLKTLFGVHAHDSMGGCNTDAVNQDIKQRLLQIKEELVTQITLSQRLIAMHAPAPAKPHSRLIMHNLQPQARSYAPCQLELLTHSPHFEIWDEHQLVPHLLVSQNPIDAGLVDRQIAARQQSVTLYQSKIYLEYSSPKGLASHYLVVKELEANHQAHAPSLEYVENRFYRCCVTQDGHLELIQQEKQQLYVNFLQIINAGDAGDSYDYSPPHDDFSVAAHWQLIEVIKSHNYQCMKLEATLHCPLNAQQRSQKQQTTVQKIAVNLLFSENSPTIKLEMHTLNHLYDQRTRLFFNLNLASDHLLAGIPMGSCCYPTTLNSEVAAAAKSQQWSEKPLALVRFQEFICLKNQQASFALFSRSLNECEYVDQGVSFTLWRSFSHLGKSDLINRPGRPSGIEVATPDAQLIDTSLAFNATFSLYHTDNAAAMACHHNYPLQAYQLTAYQRFNLNAPKQTKVAWQACTLNLKGAVISAFKQAQSNPAQLFLRLYNPQDQAIIIDLPANSYLANALEQPQALAKHLKLEPQQIGQILLTKEESPNERVQ